VESIIEMPTPNDKRSVQRFLGMVNYLHTFCPALSDVVHPLQNLIKSEIQFVWSEVHEKAFKKAKELIANAPCLAYFDPCKLVVLQADASETGLGGAICFNPQFKASFNQWRLPRPPCVQMKFCGHK
jgi:hypothetical protein